MIYKVKIMNKEGPAWFALYNMMTEIYLWMENIDTAAICTKEGGQKDLSSLEGPTLKKE